MEALAADASRFIFQHALSKHAIWLTCGVAAIGVAALVRDLLRTPRSQWAAGILRFSSPWLAPAVALLCGLTFASSCVYPATRCPGFALVAVASLAVFPIAAYAVWCGRPFRLPTACSSVVASHATIFAALVAGMSITDDWL